MSLIGPLFDSGKLEQAVLATLSEGSYLANYIAHASIEAGLVGSLPPIQSFNVVSEFDYFPEDNLPSLVVEAPGLRDEPQRDGEGYWRATWIFEVAVVVAGRTANEARRNAQIYQAAVRGAMLQLNLNGTKASVKAWLDEATAKVPERQRRNLFATSDVFSIEVEDVVNQFGESSDEATQYPQITEVDVEVVKREQ